MIKKYNPTNLSQLSRHLGVTTAHLHNLKNGKTPDKELNTLSLILSGAGFTDKVDKYTKFSLLMKGWEEHCKQQTK